MDHSQLIKAQLYAANSVREAHRLAAIFPAECIDQLRLSVYEKDYLKLLVKILGHGTVKTTRTGSLSLSLEAQQLDINIADGVVPLLYSKEIFHKTFLKENRWFFSGSTDVESLKADGVHIWDSWVTPETARFESVGIEQGEYRRMQGRDVESYVRCKLPQAWPVLVQYKRDRKIGTLNNDQGDEFKEWFQSYKDDTISPSTLNQLKHDVKMMPLVKLVGGDIGSGAYGASWRKINDTRYVPHYDKKIEEDMNRRGFVEEDLGIVESGHVYTRGIDQLANVVSGLKNDPFGRRHIMSAWNIPLIDETVLPACHSFVQFISSEQYNGQKRLTCQLHQRSSDGPVGLPFNVGQYAAMTHMVAEATGHAGVRLVVNIGDAHIYFSQLPFIEQQLRQAVQHSKDDLYDSRFSDPVIEGIKGITLDDFAKVLPTIGGYEKFKPSVPYPVEV